ncbi:MULTISPECIES: SsrA-binding protein SmpB [Thermoactinomyces]|jgi:SsrA-binding protein|uniref:SsrA-binding protein n=1 Tax=Thermoactinomyces daqus TaxID=1329516 RepID=A0A7W1XAD6_9BACL|nr:MULTISPECIES: SsrA-binding protein SmpB [Thermoactinomyces]MBA4543063.1 SsrA-binding protein SmpB [Thermoactinomyces daqus]MBH8598723.1 SsrA-binding protein SmpB [Thermoactinomyces sp. CICC 10523]MBH8605529.1 SsrA-binding protein SmpB [Thermoactinomyces sp. CICC 10522]MBH8608784.1 SsrA-binding protein SmpB [Thermoactinomyces sp. CICC 10521]
MGNKGTKVIAKNKKAYHDYHIEETFEAGIVLTGTEIKSIRQGRVNLKDSYARIDQGELFIIGMHISPFEQGNRFNVDPTRTRKLLMHRKEIDKLLGQTKIKGLTLIPLDIHLRNGFAKVQLGLGRGKKLYDKRATEAKRDAERMIRRKLKEQNFR